MANVCSDRLLLALGRQRAAQDWRLTQWYVDREVVGLWLIRRNFLVGCLPSLYISMICRCDVWLSTCAHPSTQSRTTNTCRSRLVSTEVDVDKEEKNTGERTASPFADIRGGTHGLEHSTRSTHLDALGDAQQLLEVEEIVGMLKHCRRLPICLFSSR
jgi:hypothetical protein